MSYPLWEDEINRRESRGDSGWVKRRAGTTRDGREEEKLKLLLNLVKGLMYKLEDPSSIPRDGGRKGLENPRTLTSVQLCVYPSSVWLPQRGDGTE